MLIALTEPILQIELVTALIDSAGHQNINSDSKFIRLKVISTHLERRSGHIPTARKSEGMRAP